MRLQTSSTAAHAEFYSVTHQSPNLHPYAQPDVVNPTTTCHIGPRVRVSPVKNIAQSLAEDDAECVSSGPANGRYVHILISTRTTFSRIGSGAAPPAPSQRPAAVWHRETCRPLNGLPSAPERQLQRQPYSKTRAERSRAVLHLNPLLWPSRKACIPGTLTRCGCREHRVAEKDAGVPVGYRVCCAGSRLITGQTNKVCCC